MSDPSEQMYHLWKYQDMTDTSLRLRFLVCRQLELAISGMFPHCQVLPFGSAINGLGTCSSDQDMTLLFDELKKNKRNRLVFQAKSALYGGDRAQVRLTRRVSRLTRPCCRSRGTARSSPASSSPSSPAVRTSRRSCTPGSLSSSTNTPWLVWSATSP